MSRAKSKKEQHTQDANVERDDGPARERQADDTLRQIHTWLLFWKYCADKRCHRARACRGELKPCHRRFWPQVPEEIKAWLQKAFAARRAGLSPQQAVRAADKAIAEYRVPLARYDEMVAKMKAAPVAPARDAAPMAVKRDSERVPARVRIV
jgi:hypothetical protein